MYSRTGLGVIGIWLTALLMQGCASSYRSAPSTLPRLAHVVTSGVVVEAEDGSWRLESGEPTQFTPPVFVTTDWDNRAKSSNSARLTSHFEEAGYDPSARLRRGEMNVRVMTPSRAEPLYGKIIFFDVRNRTDDSSARRMWTIAVPQRYVAVAESGNIATVYQPYRDPSGRDVVSWVLWISSVPIE